MVKGIGTDIIEVGRIRKSIERYGARFLNKMFSLSERAYCEKFVDSAPHYAVRFAGKEAVVKAFGTGFRGIGWQDIEIINDDNGKPTVKLSVKAKEIIGNRELQITLSHCKEYAVAFAVLL